MVEVSLVAGLTFSSNVRVARTLSALDFVMLETVSTSTMDRQSVAEVQRYDKVSGAQ
jgi:hypothetical protein